VLGDSSKREMYDRYGSAFESTAGGGGRGGPWGAPGAGAADSVDFSDLFGERFGPGAAGGFADIFKQFRRAGGAGSRQHRRRARGADLEHSVEVPFTQAVLGGQARITVRRQHGKTDSIEVKIPPGTNDGQKIRLRGQGEPGLGGGPAGDILLRVHVLPHPCFRRRGNDLEVRVPITLAEAVQGAKVDVPTPKGTISLRIPAGTSSGKRLRIKGHGVAAAGKPPGDLYAEVLIQLPDRLDADDQRLVEKLAAKYPHDPRSELQW